MTLKPKQHRIKPLTTERARLLPQKSTVPERILWSMLRDRRLGGLKFRRQCPIGPFVADFVCTDTKLVVELDGLSHAGHAEHDQNRTTYFEQAGYRVIRATNDDLLADRFAVAGYILRTPGQPSPIGRGNKSMAATSDIPTWKPAQSLESNYQYRDGLTSD